MRIAPFQQSDFLGARPSFELLLAGQRLVDVIVRFPVEQANHVVTGMQVLRLLGSGQMDPKTAGLMLYGLQTASANLKNTKLEAEKATDVVIDRHTVDQTCINGPQWFARDFADGVEEGEPSRAAASGEKVQAEVPSGKVRADKRKTPEMQAYCCCCCCSWSMRGVRAVVGRDWMTRVGGSWTGGGASEGLTVTETLRALCASPLWTPRVGGTSA